MRDTITIAPGNCPTQALPLAPSRRGLFGTIGTIGAMLLLTAAEAGPAKAAELDGDLIALAAEYVAMQRADRAAYEAMTEVEKQAAARARPAPWSEEAQRTPDKLLVARIARLPARTPEGLHAKAQVIPLPRMATITFTIADSDAAQRDVAALQPAMLLPEAHACLSLAKGCPDGRERQAWAVRAFYALSRHLDGCLTVGRDDA